MKAVRVFMPIGNQYYLESTFVEINGIRSFQPPQGQPQLREKNFIDQEVMKGNAVVDASLSFVDCLKPGMANQRQAKGSMAQSGVGVSGSQNQITISLTPGAVADGTCRLGWTSLVGYFNGTSVKNAELTIGGTFSTDTLSYLTKLLDFGIIRIAELEFNGSSDAVFEATQPIYKRYNAFGEIIEEKRINYPLPKSIDQDTTIRLMDRQYLSSLGANLELDGYSYLELFITKSLTASIVVTLEIVPRG